LLNGGVDESSVFATPVFMARREGFAGERIWLAKKNLKLRKINDLRSSDRHIATPRTALNTENGIPVALNSVWVDGSLSCSKGRQRVRVHD
jgi:hypothetical protein